MPSNQYLPVKRIVCTIGESPGAHLKMNDKFYDRLGDCYWIYDKIDYPDKDTEYRLSCALPVACTKLEF